MVSISPQGPRLSAPRPSCDGTEPTRDDAHHAPSRPWPRRGAARQLPGERRAHVSRLPSAAGGRVVGSLKRSGRPSAQRYSMVIVRPSLQPSSRSHFTNASTHSRWLNDVPEERARPEAGSRTLGEFRPETVSAETETQPQKPRQLRASWPSLGNLAVRRNAWWAREDSNLQPDRYERSALTVELWDRSPCEFCPRVSHLF